MCSNGAAALLCAVVLLLTTGSSFGSPTTAPKPATDCHIWGNYTTGVDMLRKMMTQYYNSRNQLERDIATDLFQSNALGMIGVYSSLLFISQQNSTDNLIPALFATAMKQTMTHACEWLLSFGDTFTLFDIDCTDTAQLILLSSFIRLRPLLDSTYTALQNFSCATDGSYNDQWLANNVPSYTKELRQLNMLPANMQ